MSPDLAAPLARHRPASRSHATCGPSTLPLRSLSGESGRVGEPHSVTRCVSTLGARREVRPGPSASEARCPFPSPAPRFTKGFRPEITKGPLLPPKGFLDPACLKSPPPLYLIQSHCQTSQRINHLYDLAFICTSLSLRSFPGMGLWAPRPSGQRFTRSPGLWCTSLIACGMNELVTGLFPACGQRQLLPGQAPPPPTLIKQHLHSVF